MKKVSSSLIIFFILALVAGCKNQKPRMYVKSLGSFDTAYDRHAWEWKEIDSYWYLVNKELSDCMVAIHGPGESQNELKRSSKLIGTRQYSLVEENTSGKPTLVTFSNHSETLFVYPGNDPKSCLGHAEQILLNYQSETSTSK